MKLSNMHEAKTKLSQLVGEALDGEEVVIANAGKPLVRLVAFQTAPPKRIPGYWKGKVRMAANFDDYLDPTDLIPSLKES
jgi:antitoxin (DNA-binding transcriptional repressor) of toxin-antitoxin stability system